MNELFRAYSEPECSRQQDVDLLAPVHQIANQVAEELQTVSLDLVVYFNSLFTRLSILILLWSIVDDVENLEVQSVLLEDAIKVLELVVCQALVGIEEV